MKNIYFFARDFENTQFVGSITMIPTGSSPNTSGSYIYGNDRKTRKNLTDPTIFTNTVDGQYLVQMKGPTSCTSFYITVPDGIGNETASALITTFTTASVQALTIAAGDIRYAPISHSTTSASYALSSSHALRANLARYADAAGYISTAIYSLTSTSASHAIRATTASYSITSSWANSSITAIGADFAVLSNTSLLSDTASYGITAISADFAVLSNTSLQADSASWSTNAISASWAPYIDTTGTTLTSSGYTFTDIDNGKIITTTGSVASSFTIPESLVNGWNSTIFQSGSGQLTFLTGAASVQLLNRQTHTKTAGQYALVSLLQVSPNIYLLAGDTTA